VRLTDGERELRAQAPDVAASSIIASTQPLTSGEAMVLQWVIAPLLSGPVTREGAALIATPGLWRQVAGGDAKPDAAALRAAREKISSPLFRAVGRVGISVRGPDRAEHLMWRVIGVLHSLRRPGVALRERTLPTT
jgi:hypothetical protein